MIRETLKLEADLKRETVRKQNNQKIERIIANELEAAKRPIEREIEQQIVTTIL